mgnify:CR=1 FL=1
MGNWIWLLVKAACLFMIVFCLTACQTASPYVRMTYTAKQLEQTPAPSDRTICVTRFLDMRQEKGNLVTPEANHQVTALLLCNEDLGNWVANAIMKELKGRGYNVREANLSDVKDGEFCVGGNIHMAEFENMGFGYTAKVLIDVNLRLNGVALMNRQYFNSNVGSPTPTGAPKTFEKVLRESLSETLGDITSVVTQYEGIAK